MNKNVYLHYRITTTTPKSETMKNSATTPAKTTSNKSTTPKSETMKNSATTPATTETPVIETAAATPARAEGNVIDLRKKPAKETAAAAEPVEAAAAEAAPQFSADEEAILGLELELAAVSAKIEKTPAKNKNQLAKLNHQKDTILAEIDGLKNPVKVEEVVKAPKAPAKEKITTDKLELTPELIEANLKPKTRKSVLLKSQIMTEAELKASHPDFATDYQYIPMHEYIELVFLAKEYYAKQIEAAKQTIVNKIS